MRQKRLRCRLKNKGMLIPLIPVMATIITFMHPAHARDDRFKSSDFSVNESIKQEAPYVATPIEVVRAMLDLGSVGPNDFLIDLGSGDGRIVIIAAKEYGASGFGVDFNQKLIELSKKKAVAEGVERQTEFFTQNIFKTDIRKATVVTMYLLNEVNLELRPKLLNELKPSTRVISHDFHMGEWRPDKMKHLDVPRLYQKDSILYLWNIPAKVAGQWQWQLLLRGENQFFDLEMSQTFQVISGVVHNQGYKFLIFNPSLEGDRIRFSLISEADERMVQQDYAGRVEGDTIVGTVKLGGSIKTIVMKWRAKRIRKWLPIGFADEREHSR